MSLPRSKFCCVSTLKFLNCPSQCGVANKESANAQSGEKGRDRRQLTVKGKSNEKGS